MNQPTGLEAKNVSMEAVAFLIEIPKPLKAVPRPRVEAVVPAWEAVSLLVAVTWANSDVVVSRSSPVKFLVINIAFICSVFNVDW